MFRFSLTLLFLVIGTFLFAQEVSESCAKPPKKAFKLIQKSKETNVGSEKVMALMEAIAIAPDNAMAYYEYGTYAFEDAMRLYDKGTDAAAVSGDKSMVKAEEMIQKALSYCPDYHANCFYYLGVINYYQKDNVNALKYLKEFQNYESKDVARYASDHDQKLADIKDIVTQLEDEVALYNNPVPFKPVKVPNVSSAIDDYIPMISPDNEVMFYTRRIEKKIAGDPTIHHTEQFTFSQRGSNTDPFSGGLPFTAPFNDGYFDGYGAATMAVDNKEMVFCACKDIMSQGQKYRNCDLYITRYERTGAGGNDFSWTPFENLGPGINGPTSWEAQPTLSADGNTLIFTKAGANTQDNDLYISHRMTNGKWSNAVPITQLNTAGKDKSPFLHQDSETLYFVSSSSETRRGVGGTDIFYTRLERDEKGRVKKNPDGTEVWSKPKNIGYPINTKEDEVGIFVSTDGKLAYYSSKHEGDWNIYQFDLYKEARPHPVALIKGDLKDDAGNPIDGATIEIAYGSTGETEKVKVNGHDGKYAAIVRIDEPQDVAITVKKEGHSFDTKMITKKEVEKIREFVTGDKKEHLAVSKHSNHKDSSHQVTTHKDYLHTKTASEHHAQSQIKTDSLQALELAAKPVVKASGEELENSIMDGSSALSVTTNTSSTEEENSILDGGAATSMVIRSVNMDVSPLKVGMTYAIKNILFASNSIVLTEKSKFIIKEFSKFMLENPTIEIVIQGHTDDVGDAAKNVALSTARSEAVKNYLVSLGVEATRLEAKGFGSAQPKVPNDTPQNRAINRRTDFLISKI
jgi:outer membrane protein OmpA-like peptidoglycan-associated protein/tetratricopeptide (TPR) repeat protein